MSFNNQVFGCVPNNDFIFSTTNVSSDNASFDNLSVSDTATITNLITTTFNPAAITTTTLTTNILNASTGNISDINTSTITADTAFITDLEITTLDIESISVDTAEIELLQLPDIDPAFTGEESEIQRNGGILTIAGGNMVGAVEKVGQINITPYNLSNTATPSINVAIDGTTTINGQTQIPNLTSSFQFIDQNTTYRSGGATIAVISANTTTLSIAAGATENILLSSGATEYINVNPVADETTIRNLDAEGNASFDGNINIVGDITVNAVNSVDVNTSRLDAINASITSTLETSQLTATGLAQFESTLAIKNPSSQSQNFFWNSTAFQLGNLASVDFNIGNNGAAPDKGIIVRGGTNSSVEIPILTVNNLSCDLTPNIAAGVGITVTSVGGIATITNTGIVTDPLNISTLNTSQVNASDVHTEALNVSGSAAFLADGLTVFGQTTTQNISTANISSTAFITASGEVSAGGGLKATDGSGVFSTGVIHLNNQANGLGDSLEIYYTGTQFGMGTTSGKDFTINAGINTGGLVIDGTLNNVNMSNCSITNLSLDNLTYDLTPNLTAGTGITITSVGGKPTITATGGGGTVPDPLNLSQLNASNISVDGDIELIGTSNISANATTATVFKVVAENISVSNDITCSNLTRTATLESVGNTSVGFDLSVANDATITRDLQVQRYLDAGKPTFIMLRRTANTAMSGTAFNAIFNSNTSGQVNGEFTTASGVSVIVATGGWYRVSWGLGFKRTSNTGGDRAAVRAYVRTRPQGGSYSFNSAKNVIGSSCYMRRTNQCREGHVSGYNLVYISAGGAVSLRIEAMVEGNASWNSSLTGIDLRGSSNLMVEFVSSAAET